MKLRFILLFLVALSLFSCKNESSSTAVEQQPSAPTLPKPTHSPANTIGNLIQEKPLSEHAVQFYTNHLWQYAAAVVTNHPEQGAAYNGKWIKLKPDNTLETGFYDGPITYGSWSVDEEKDIISIIEEAEQPISTEWKMKKSSSSDGIMIWIGTQKYGNNNTQIKMLRNSEKPSKE